MRQGLPTPGPNRPVQESKALFPHVHTRGNKSSPSPERISETSSRQTLQCLRETCWITHISLCYFKLSLCSLYSHTTELRSWSSSNLHIGLILSRPLQFHFERLAFPISEQSGNTFHFSDEMRFFPPVSRGLLSPVACLRF